MADPGAHDLPDLPTLSGQDWLASPALARVLEALGGGEETRIVGGAVRNALFGQPVKDVDLATRLLPDEVMRRAGAAGIKAVPTGIDHGTVTLIADEHPFEVTTLRLDVETFGRHARVAFTDDWKEDARRRDFTINALYADAEGKIHDPLGGIADVAARRVRFIGDADARIGEDYLRILRFFRLHAEYGQGALDGRGLAACIRGRHGLPRLSAERLGQEMLRLAGARDPLSAVVAMRDSGILEEMLAGVVHPVPLAKLLEIEAALELPADRIVRLAILCCEIEEDADRLLQRLRLARDDHRRLVAASRGWRELAPGMRVDERRAALYRAGPGAFADRVLMAWTHRGGAADDADWAGLYRTGEDWRAPELPWRGEDLKRRGIASGPRIGGILKRAEELWIGEGFPDREESLDRLLEQAVALEAGPAEG